MKLLDDLTYRRLIAPIVLLVFLAPAVLLSQEVKQEIAEALTAGDTTLAIDLLEKDIKLDPSYEYNYYVLGQIFVKQKKYAEAEEQFQTALKKNKKFYSGLYALSKVQLRLGKIDEAEKNIKIGLKKSKKMKGEFHNGMGLVYIAKGMYNEADTEIRQAILQDEKIAEYHINLGDANFKSKVYTLAASEYEKALELDTASLDIYFRWAEACLELRDYNCALEKLMTVLRKDSTHIEAWLRTGSIYYMAARSSNSPEEIKQRYIEAIGSYKKFIELSDGKADSVTGRAYYESGMAYLVLHGYEDANKNFATVLAIPVEPKDIYFYYGRSFQGIQEYDSALVYYRKHTEWVEQQDPDFNSAVSDKELFRRMGECYQAKKDHYNTINYFERSLAFDSTQERLLYGTAVAYTLTGDYRNALIYYMKRIALGVDSRYWFIYYNAATAAKYLEEKGGLAMVEDDDLGLDDEEDIVVEPGPDPLEGVDLLQLAVEYLKKIDVDFWDEIYANEKNRKTALKARSMLASTYLYQLSDCANGVAQYEKVLELVPDDCDAMKALGYAYFGGICPSNYTKSLKFLKQARTCAANKGGSECDDIDMMLWTAQTYHFRAVERVGARQKEQAVKDFEAADNWYLKVLKCDPGNAAATDGHRQVKYEH